MGLFPPMAMRCVAGDVRRDAPLWAVQGHNGAELTLAFLVKLAKVSVLARSM